ncbi:histone deacetylase [Sporobolomyces koalae]|uniref:histone deacetylase n=1 Tax=Sporobolomyces koalae TaxID=500713 RepID=UPI0031751DF6
MAVSDVGEQDQLSNLVSALSLGSAELAPPVPLVRSTSPLVDQPDRSTTKPFVLFQPECDNHRYIRNHHDPAEIVERPERIRAVKAAVAAAYAQLARPTDEPHPLDLSGLSLHDSPRPMQPLVERDGPFDILVSSRQLALDDPALALIHASPATDLDPIEAPWPVQLAHLVKSVPPLEPSSSTARESEVPPHLPQGDLYLCPESGRAILGALGAVCEGVDLVMTSQQHDRGFVVVRPPGHHCGEATPQGFCWVNNVAVAAAHAHLEHGINRVLIIDIDLHHGNGTQEIVWNLNERANDLLVAHQESTQNSASARRRRSGTKEPEPPRPLQLMYSSIHDVLSYPCESGDAGLIANASLNILGPHGQFIQNQHLSSSSIRESNQEFLDRYWHGLGGDQVEQFFRLTNAKPEETLILVSAGFDASPFEYSSMSRHHHSFPSPTFYETFTLKLVQETCRKFSNGRVLFVLEGGYSDLALVNGTIGVLRGLTETKTEVRHEQDAQQVKREYEKVLKACRIGTGGGGMDNTKRKGTRRPRPQQHEEEKLEEPWIRRTKEIFERLEPQTRTHEPHVKPKPNRSGEQQTNLDAAAGGGGRQLRTRKFKMDYAGLADVSPPNSTFLRQQQQPQKTLTTEPTEPRVSVPVLSDLDSSNQQPIPSHTDALPNLDFDPKIEPESSGSDIGRISRTDQHDSIPASSKIKFVWKQGGIGTTPSVPSSSTTATTPDNFVQGNKGSLENRKVYFPGEPRI